MNYDLGDKKANTLDATIGNKTNLEFNRVFTHVAY